MPTAASIIKKSMQDLGQLRAGASPSANDQTDCYNRLNPMLKLWANTSLLIPFNTQISHTLDGSSSYTIGSGATINTTKPVHIDSAYVRENGDDYSLYVCRDRAEFDRIVDKSLTGFPRTLYYDKGIATGTVYIWPVGNSSYTLYLNTRGFLTEFPDEASTDVSLPDGYEELIQYHLAIRCAPMFEVSVSNELVSLARTAMAEIKRNNAEAPVMVCDYPTSSPGYRVEEG